MPDQQNPVPFNPLPNVQAQKVHPAIEAVDTGIKQDDTEKGPDADNMVPSRCQRFTNYFGSRLYYDHLLKFHLLVWIIFLFIGIHLMCTYSPKKSSIKTNGNG